MTSKKETPKTPEGSPEIVDGPTVAGVHDLTDHPAVESGVIRNPGDTVLDRDPNEPSHRRPEVLQQGAATRKTTTSDPAKKTGRAAGKGDGTGPES
jgi:hypothetical protein